MSSDTNQQPTVTPAPNGPLLVKGLTDLTGADGKPVAPKPVMALCRCGQTGTRPMCDGSHAKVGFTDEKLDGRQPDRRDSYVGKKITIHDNRGICSHAGFCTDNLPKVWRMRTEPWIDPDGEMVDKIIEVINMCPSGALSYSINEVEHEDHDRAAAIQIVPNGPFFLQGGVELNEVKLLEGTPDEHRTLCRCGESKNKPFCDGTHWYAKFRDDGLIRVSTFSELEDDKPLTDTVEGVELRITKDGDRAVVTDRASEELKLEVKIVKDEVLISVAAVKSWKAGSNASVAEPTTDGKAANHEEPHNEFIHHLAEHGLSKLGSHGPMGAMGVPHYDLPAWDDLQFVTAQLHKLPQLDDVSVGTELVIGPRAAKPLRLKIPLFVSDMSFGSLSQEAKISLARGAEMAGTGICSGEGGMLPEEQAENSRYLYELASARFGFTFDQLKLVQAFHFKGGQAAKTGTGGHLPGNKVTNRIAEVRGLKPGQDAISPARFPEWNSLAEFKDFAAQVREKTGGIPVGFKLSAQHIEKDIDAALEVGVDYIILDGRGGGTGAAPLIFRDNISVPTMPALARARRHLDQSGQSDVTLIITGGLRTPADFAKALALGADGIAIANSAIQAIGCVGARICHTNNCPAGIATQDETLRQMIDPEIASKKLHRFLEATVHLMSIMARACGHTHLNQFSRDDLTTWQREIAHLTGVPYGGLID